MKIIKEMQRRPFSFGEGIRGMRPNKEQKPDPPDGGRNGRSSVLMSLVK